jgi:hypothetical protein
MIFLSQILLRVAGLLVEILGIVLDVPAKDLLGPVLGSYFFHGDGDGLFAVIEDVANFSGDGIGKALLLRFGFSGPEFDDDVRHEFNLS